MTPACAYRLGVRSALAEQRGDDAGKRALFGDVVREATRLQRAGKRDAAEALCWAYEDGARDTEYKELRADLAADLNH